MKWFEYIIMIVAIGLVFLPFKFGFYYFLKDYFITIIFTFTYMLDKNYFYSLQIILILSNAIFTLHTYI